MNVYQPMKRSLVALGVTLAIVVGAQAMAQMNPVNYAQESALPTIAAVSVAPTCVSALHAPARRVCYQANVVVGEPVRLETAVPASAR